MDTRQHRSTVTLLAAVAAVLVIAASPADASAPTARSSTIGASTTHFPTGTFLTKITTADLYRAGLDLDDAHWEKVTYRADGTWTDIWFHPRVSNEPPAHGRYVVRGDTLRVLGTPDTLRWHYDGHALRFKPIRVPDRLARLIYTVHPWKRIR